MSTIETPTATSSGTRRLVFLVWLLLGFFYFYLSWGYIRVGMADQRFADYLQYVVNVAGGEQRPAKEIRALILVKAEQLSLPVTGNQINIVGSGQNLKVQVNYSTDIEIPLLLNTGYTKQFSHEVQYRTTTR